MIRESRAEGRDQTTQALHKARKGYTWLRTFTTVSSKWLFIKCFWRWKTVPLIVCV